MPQRLNVVVQFPSSYVRVEMVGQTLPEIRQESYPQGLVHLSDPRCQIVKYRI